MSHYHDVMSGREWLYITANFDHRSVIATCCGLQFTHIGIEKKHLNDWYKFVVTRSDKKIEFQAIGLLGRG